MTEPQTNWSLISAIAAAGGVVWVIMSKIFAGATRDEVTDALKVFREDIQIRDDANHKRFDEVISAMTKNDDRAQDSRTEMTQTMHKMGLLLAAVGAKVEGLEQRTGHVETKIDGLKK